ncbi:hypothetical protein [Nocardia pseudovaccinii]|uniref:hypothetical protein n=1 Tax=Nocardia pseudovaccinii TaxID=189540 RepID=UPI0007A430FB|nr:hypothetical protein [Nocardia pseudovaccinii]
MTDSQRGPDGQSPMLGGIDPAVRQPDPSAGGWVMPDRPPGQGYGPTLPYPPPSTGSGRTVLVIAGVLGLVVVLGLGVAIGVVVGRGDSSSESAVVSATARRETGTYSMNAITNACDLVDPTPLTKWSPTSKGAPEHRETRPTAYGSGGLKCDAGYTSATAGEFPMNAAGMSVEAEFTNGAAPPFYDHWKHADVATPEAASASGAVTGIGNQGYWYSEVRGNLVANMAYVVCVQDGNVSVRVKISLTREQGSPAVRRDELDSIARSQVRRTLDGLREK